MHVHVQYTPPVALWIGALLVAWLICGGILAPSFGLLAWQRARAGWFARAPRWLVGVLSYLGCAVALAVVLSFPFHSGVIWVNGALALLPGIVFGPPLLAAWAIERWRSRAKRRRRWLAPGLLSVGWGMLLMLWAIGYEIQATVAVDSSAVTFVHAAGVFEHGRHIRIVDADGQVRHQLQISSDALPCGAVTVEQEGARVYFVCDREARGRRTPYLDLQTRTVHVGEQKAQF